MGRSLIQKRILSFCVQQVGILINQFDISVNQLKAFF